MKKTLLAIMTVAGLPAYADMVESLDGITPFTQGFGADGLNDMTGDKWWKSNVQTVASGLGYDGAQIGVYGAGYSDFTLGGDQMSAFNDGDWTIEFSVGNLRRPGSAYTSAASFAGEYLFSIGGSSRTTGLTHSAALLFTIDGYLRWDTTIGGNDLYAGNSVKIDLAPVDPLLNTSDYTTFRFVSNTTENRFDIFVDGQLVSTTENYNLIGEGLKSIHFNGSPNDGEAGANAYKMDTGIATLTDVKVWDVALDTTPPSVPEPATASLSLLGLTALMMRRRRA